MKSHKSHRQRDTNETVTIQHLQDVSYSFRNAVNSAVHTFTFNYKRKNHSEHRYHRVSMYYSILKNPKSYIKVINICKRVVLIQCVPRKWFRSAVCDTIYTIYLSCCTQTADPNPFRDTLVITVPRGRSRSKNLSQSCRRSSSSI